jgi:hypothetical protein
LERCKLILVKRMHVSQPFSGLFQLGVLHSSLMSIPILRRRRRGQFDCDLPGALSWLIPLACLLTLAKFPVLVWMYSRVSLQEE